MNPVRGQQFGNPRGSFLVEEGATVGALVGENLFVVENGRVRVLRAEEVINPPTSGDEQNPATIWRQIGEIPPNLLALAALAGMGLVALDGDGGAAARSIQEGVGIAVANGNGVAGDPTIALATLANGGGGALVRVQRDAYGRVAGTSPVQPADIPVFRHDQAVASDSWIINHNLGRAAGARVYTVGGMEVWAGVLSLNTNQTQILLAEPMAGYAIVQ